MNLSENELLEEKKHAQETIQTIKEIIKEKNVDIEKYKEKVIKEKKYIWQNKHEFKDVELYNTMDESDLNTDLLNKDIDKVYRLHRSLDIPYFSRIDFKTDNHVKTFYIGLTSIQNDLDIIVYDWRASIANLYYNYGVGKSMYETPDAIVRGETTLKRNFEFSMGKLKSIYDSNTEVNDIILENILRNNSSDMMKNIVSTIGKEQNEIIRYPNTHLIVEGTAGSGKTSVALHRIAYLLYNQKNLNYKNTLIFSPSEVFSHYISNVLPELGEENVATTTFNDFASNYIKNIKLESLTEFIERYYENSTYEYDIEVKLSLEYKNRIDKYLNELFEKLKFKKKIGFKKKELTAHDLNKLKNKVPSHLKFYDKLIYLSEKIISFLELDEEKYLKKFYNIVTKILDIEKDPIRLYENFNKEKIKEKINYEDICGILYLYFEITGYPSFTEVKCIVIDEAQDYSNWQFELIKGIFNRAKFTILGDVNQSLNPYIKHESLKTIEHTFKGAHYKRLQYSYRSSREIIEYANGIINLTNDNIIRKSFGIPVNFIETSDIIESIKNTVKLYHEKSIERIAVITKTNDEAEKIKSLNKDNLIVLPVYVSKGLEFDGVIIIDVNNNFMQEKNLLYVASTRALHGLTIIKQKK